MTRWNRADFTGVLKEEFLPDWAKPKLAALREQAPVKMESAGLEEAAPPTDHLDTEPSPEGPDMALK